MYSHVRFYVTVFDDVRVACFSGLVLLESFSGNQVSYAIYTSVVIYTILLHPLGMAAYNSRGFVCYIYICLCTAVNIHYSLYIPYGSTPLVWLCIIQKA